MFGHEEKVPVARLTAVQYVVLFIFLLLAYGLWRLQVMHSGKYEQLAEQNRVRNVPILAPRGKILDRDGRVIVDNHSSFSLFLSREDLKKVTFPVLVVCGEKDVLTGPPDPLAAAFGNGRTVTVPNRDHMTAVGDKVYKQAVLEFFAG